MTEEKATQKAILDYLALRQKKLGFQYWRNNSGGMPIETNGSRRFIRFGTTGSPDIFVFYKGVLYGLEVKGSKGKMSASQVEWQEGMDRNMGVYRVVRSLDEVIALGL